MFLQIFDFIFACFFLKTCFLGALRPSCDDHRLSRRKLRRTVFFRALKLFFGAFSAFWWLIMIFNVFQCLFNVFEYIFVCFNVFLGPQTRFHYFTRTIRNFPKFSEMTEQYTYRL